MAARTQEPPIEKRSSEDFALFRAIGDKVIAQLGRPSDFNRVDVRRLWNDRYRVNVLTGMDAVSIRIAHSFFLVSDDAANISTATPRIAKSY